MLSIYYMTVFRKAENAACTCVIIIALPPLFFSLQDIRHQIGDRSVLVAGEEKMRPDQTLN